MAKTLYEKVTGRKFKRTSETLAFLFDDYERIKHDKDTVLWRLLVAQSLDFIKPISSGAHQKTPSAFTLTSQF
ncbi:hypothetical protein EII31_04810 [Leucobacter sp. OH2974_COT-288]|nr:hypothetical protein EII31_04810 [Leucobacter sp. OH2974_COT-288]